MSNEIGKLKFEIATLRTALAKIGGFANSWTHQYGANPFGGLAVTANVVEKFKTIEQTCKTALDEKKAPEVPLTYVQVGGSIHAGNIIDENPMPDYPDWVEIEVVDVDPTTGRMSVVGPKVE